ncbi:MAG: BamA/TamA family outer membrane protein [Dongiaceae bacterium]
MQRESYDASEANRLSPWAGGTPRANRRLYLSVRGVIVAAALTVVVLAAAGAAHAQSRVRDNISQQLDEAETADDVAVGRALDDSFGIYAMPIPIVNPTIGNGLAVGTLATFRLDSTDRVSPRSSVAAGVGYTDTQTYAFGASASLYLDEDRYRLDLMSGYGNANLKFYGIGTDSIFSDDPLDFNIRGLFASANLRARVADHFYLGPLYKYLDSTANFDVLPGSILRPIDLDFRLSGAGVIAEYDTRDTSFSPHTGSYAEMEMVRFDERIGSDFDFFSLDGSAARYLELTPDLVLAGQGRLAAVAGDAPFFALPYVTLRGFPGGKYLNDVTWQAQAELRWRVFWRIGVVAFAGVGQVAPNLGAFVDNDVLYAGGAGLRFVASESERVNLGIDYARASDGEHAFYFRIGEAF